MSMHLAAISPVLNWVYVAVNLLLGLVGIIGVIAALSGTFSLMKWYSRLFWLMTVVTFVWETASFSLAYTRRQETVDACQSELTTLANSTVLGTIEPVSHNATEAKTYGESTCEGSVKAGMIGLGVILVVGQLLQLYFGFIVSSYVSQLREHHRGHRLRDTDWDDSAINLNESKGQSMAVHPLHKA
ncbi:hypothetical protein BC937DRAFT_87513 [Endogone sp. FLAS-F59071]|nr:hypothetical protein BC937DRAFT_87513 [Endogone sp. FLAS-F59071]|eukprot:RUS19424.1 hypothetical protein BC937DRAFT_87513 [Endogone sp. FLAS-F59071]